MARAFLRSIRGQKRRAALADLRSIARREVERAMDERVKPALVKSHEKVVEDWKSDVGFAARKVIKPDSIAVYVFPTGEDKMVWIYVDRGTKPHPIPKTPLAAGKYLWFEWGGKGSYVPKTLAKPARTVVGGGYVEGGHLVRMKSVDHPGSDPRDFTGQIARDLEPDIHKEIDNAFRRAARRTKE